VDLVWEKEFFRFQIESEKAQEIHPETLTLDPNQRVPKGVPTFGTHLCAISTVAGVALKRAERTDRASHVLAGPSPDL
jgi:hypothetical protein